MSKVFAYDTLESTSKTAKEMALAGAGHGTVVIAERQTAGRGRYGRAFYAPGGGIYMSVVLRPEELRIETPALATICAAVRVCEAIETICDRSPGIKWVNDLFLDGKKVCGILAETVTDGAMRWVVVGIGVNFSIRAGEFPPELRGIAGSVFPDGNPTVAQGCLATEIINRMTAPYIWEGILRGYRRRMLLLGENILVNAPGGPYEARALDIDDNGQLLVEKADGSIHSLFSGEISIKRNEGQAP